MKSKKTARPEENEHPGDILNKIALSMETQTVHRVECFICLERDKTYDEPPMQAARGFRDAGWRVERSEKFQTIGLMCPKCVKTLDKDRGED